MNCIDVLRTMIGALHLESARFSLLEHFVGMNWRVRYPTVAQKVEHLEEGLVQHFPHRQWELFGGDILDDGFDPGKFVSTPGHVISVSSRVVCNSATHKHLAMMNLHPEDDLLYDDIVMVVEAVTQRMPGYLLQSGRYYHFYGAAVLDECEWIRFMAEFLMPTIIVSPRYVGHCLYRGYAALRLSTDKQYKTVLPTVCGMVGASRHAK